jgi:hypothetical protein
MITGLGDFSDPFLFLFVGEEGGKSFDTESDPRSKAND